MLTIRHPSARLPSPRGAVVQVSPLSPTNSGAGGATPHDADKTMSYEPAQSRTCSRSTVLLGACMALTVLALGIGLGVGLSRANATADAMVTTLPPSCVAPLTGFTICGTSGCPACNVQTEVSFALTVPGGAVADVTASVGCSLRAGLAAAAGVVSSRRRWFLRGSYCSTPVDPPQPSLLNQPPQAPARAHPLPCSPCRKCSSHR
jgi:hypothetical protein